MYRVKQCYTQFDLIEFWEVQKMADDRPGCWYRMCAFSTETEAIQWCCRYQDS